MPASPPNDQAKHRKQHEEAKQGNQGLNSARKRFVPEIVVRAFLHDHVALRPPLLVAPVVFPPSAAPAFAARGGAEYPREAAGGGVPRVAAEGGRAGGVRGRVHRAVVVERRRLVPVVRRLPRRALHVVRRRGAALRRRSRRRRRRQARHVRLRFRRR